MRKDRNKTTYHWINSMNNIKNELDNHNYIHIYKLIDEQNISKLWMPFLKSKKIVYKNEQGFYKWNKQIPVSIKIINAFRQHQQKVNTKKNVAQINLFKKQVPKVEVKYYNEKKNDLGLIRKFLKWLW